MNSKSINNNSITSNKSKCNELKILLNSGLETDFFESKNITFNKAKSGKLNFISEENLEIKENGRANKFIEKLNSNLNNKNEFYPRVYAKDKSQFILSKRSSINEFHASAGSINKTTKPCLLGKQTENFNLLNVNNIENNINFNNNHNQNTNNNINIIFNNNNNINNANINNITSNNYNFKNDPANDQLLTQLAYLRSLVYKCNIKNYNLNITNINSNKNNFDINDNYNNMTYHSIYPVPKENSNLVHSCKNYENLSELFSCKNRIFNTNNEFADSFENVLQKQNLSIEKLMVDSNYYLNYLFSALNSE